MHSCLWLSKDQKQELVGVVLTYCVRELVNVLTQMFNSNAYIHSESKADVAMYGLELHICVQLFSVIY